MADLKDKLERLRALYATACAERLCVNRGGFAELVGVTRQTMSSAMNGSETYLTDKLLEKAERAVHGVSVVMINSDNAHDNTQKNFGTVEDPGTNNDDVRAIVHDLTEALREERESHEKIMLALIEKIGQK